MRRLIWVMIFLLCLSFANALTNYTEAGGKNGYFNAGNSIFNSNYLNDRGLPSVNSQILTNGRGIPLIEDLNNDGINEIIVLDDGILKLYNDRTLNLVNSYTVGSQYISNLIVFDIDGDNKSEIIMARGAGKADILMLAYNSSGFVNKTSFATNTGFTYNNGEIMIKCGKTNECIGIISKELVSTVSTSTIIAFPFNSTGLGTAKQIAASATHVYCLPRIKDIQYADYNLDGIVDYTFSYIDVLGVGAQQPYIISVNINSTFGAIIKRTITPSTLGFISSTNPHDCTNIDVGAGKFLTSPLIMDAVTGGQLETVFAENTAAETYKIRVYDGTGALIASHPNLQNADGSILSNPIKMNGFFDDKTGISDKQNDYCILGYNNLQSELDLLCGSQLNSMSGFGTVEYFASYLNYNVTRSFDTYNIIAHSIFAENNAAGGNDPDELLSPYGIFKLTQNQADVGSCFVLSVNTCSCSANTQCKMEYGFENGAFNSVLISADVSKDSKEDLIAMTSGNIYYIDDKFQNSNPVICPNNADCTISPCKNSVWKVNQTASVLLLATDPDNDKVSYRIVAYAGTANEYDTGFGTNFSSGTSQTLTFNVNQTISNGLLKLYATDNNNPSSHIVQYPDITLNIANNGILAADCQSLLSGTAAEAAGGINATAGVITEIDPDNAITSGTGKIAQAFGLSSEIIWLLVMFAVGIGLWIYSHQIWPNMAAGAAFGMIVFVESLLLIIGVKLGFISFGILITIIILNIIILGFWFRGHATGTN